MNVTHPATGATALHAACGKGREDVAFALLGKGADAEVCARNGSKAAEWARMFGHAEIGDAVAQHAEGGERSAAAAVAQMTLSSYHLSTDPDEVDFTHTLSSSHFSLFVPYPFLIRFVSVPCPLRVRHVAATTPVRADVLHPPLLSRRWTWS